MSKLKGKKAKDVKPRKPKLLVWGVAGSGKTYAACSFPAPYVIDPEGGASYDQYQSMIEQGGGAYLGIDDGALHFPTLLQELDSLACEQHSYKTVVIDSVTKLWDNEIAQELDRMKKSGEKPSFGSENKPAVQNFRALVRLLNRIDMNVVLLAAEKALWKSGEQVGDGPNCWDRLAYELDASIQLINSNGQRIARAHKNRLPQLHGQKEPVTFQFHREAIYELFGKDLLEGSQEVYEKASNESVGRLAALCAEQEVPQGDIDKWLAKGNAATLSEMQQDHIDACIELLTKRSQEALEAK